MSFKGMTPVLLAVLLAFLLPGSAEISRAQNVKEIKLAMLTPQGGSLHVAFKKMAARIAAKTNGALQVRIYASGVAGDERDVTRKMQVGQLDGAIISTTGLAGIEPQLAVLDAPGLIMNYAQMEAVQKEMEKDFQEMLLKKNVKLITTWEAGQYRLFSKGSIAHVAELKKHRVWLWPDSYIMKEIWKEAGTTGVPLGINDVFGALQTGMVDTLLNTPLAVVALRWHAKLDHVGERAQGVLLMSWVVNKSKWEALPETVKKAIDDEIAETRAQAKVDARKEDVDCYNALLKRGYKTVVPTPEVNKEWDQLFDRVRTKLTGRLWPQPLYKKIEGIVSKIKG
jgi:TRAP-type transport system periplasmic protein